MFTSVETPHVERSERIVIADVWCNYLLDGRTLWSFVQVEIACKMREFDTGDSRGGSVEGIWGGGGCCSVAENGTKSLVLIQG